MVGQGGDELIKTVKVTDLNFVNPTGEPPFALLPALSLLEDGGQFFPKGINLMKLGRMSQQTT